MAGAHYIPFTSFAESQSSPVSVPRGNAGGDLALLTASRGSLPPALGSTIRN